MSDLLNIEGIGAQEVELLQATGWTDLQSVAKADVDLLTRELEAANNMLKIVPRAPERRKVERWVASAAHLLDPAGVVASRPLRSKAVVSSLGKETPGGKPAKVKRRSGTSAPAPVSDAASDELPLMASVAAEDLTDLAGEEGLRSVSGEVNYEADPEVQEMLAIAPLAIPIPARTLAEKGISPGEIAVAALMNHASGDLDVRVAVPKTDRKDIPDAPVGSRRSETLSSVQVSDVGFTMGRRGFDPGKVRTIEDAQGDAPPVRASSSKQGMMDERIALLRSPRPETNKGRKPGSKFYIRGVLHDQPLKVWFGGLFAVLLQLSVPLAVIAAPLLILSNENPEKFNWVPKWIIGFPIALPILGLLYVLVSARAKCRVCAQRLYVPKHCLKNRKAHHLPFLGHIGALALHVMTFKWFNCTFCGTSIRIKK
ncbi:DUF4332 domain-containing protein [Luteolibacter luteus]|uniref:DUF4332 domain-containing protein n=1 Tax=Luteolibacter luteus TaxID=2728835 RepID=A0A858RQT2_9BACT|nr:DUF4332 domain-containing protein [Luteolibacter luteus]QJE98283.1 DUF4332 domain-containing protein [Luteolibacter luteus]